MAGAGEGVGEDCIADLTGFPDSLLLQTDVLGGDLTVRVCDLLGYAEH